jgi:HEAT repeat protein
VRATDPDTREEARRVFLAAMQDKDPVTREIAAKCLVMMGADSEDVAERLAEALKDPSLPVRSWAITGLGLMGRKAARAIPALVERLSDEEDFCRLRICSALSSIEPSNPIVVQAMRASLYDENREIRRIAMASLGEAGPAGMPALKDIEQFLQAPDHSFRVSAAWAVSKVTQNPRVAIDVLMPELEHEDVDVRARAAHVLGELGPDAEGGMPALVRLLNDEEREVRKEAAIALGAIDPMGCVVIPVLRRAALDRDPEVREAAQGMLRKIENYKR